MPSTAVIQQLRFELSAPDTPSAHRLPERLSRLYHSQLAAVLAEELSRHPAELLPRQLAQLVVALPPLPHHRLEQDLPEQFRLALRAALAALPSATPTRLSLTAESLASLAYFLLHGTLPWQVVAPSFIPDEALRAALRTQPGALRELLRRIGSTTTVPQRLARQFSDATLGQLIGLLEPLHAPFIREYLAQTLTVPPRQSSVFGSQATFRAIVYELVISDLLASWNVSFSHQLFLEKQLRKLAVHYNLLYETLLHQLADRLTGRRVPTTLMATLQALQQQAQQSRQLPAPTRILQNLDAPASANQPRTAAAYAALVHYLRYGFLPHNSGLYFLADLSAQLGWVVRQGRTAVQELSQAAGFEAMAYTVAHRFPLAISQQLIRLLAPGQTRPFLALMAEQLTQAALPATAKLAYEQTLWQHALQHLLAAPAPTHKPVQQWLPQALWPVGSSATGTHSQFFNYLLSGAARLENERLKHTLRQSLSYLLQHEAPRLAAFLRQHSSTPLVLRRMAALADTDNLRALAMSSQASRRWQQGSSLAALFANPATARMHAPQAWLREAFLHFYLRPHGQSHPPSSAQAWHWLKAYNQPPRAVYAWLLRRVEQQPGLAQLPFFTWLLSDSPAQNTGKQIRIPTSQPGEQAAQLHLSTQVEGALLATRGGNKAERILSYLPGFPALPPVLLGEKLMAGFRAQRRGAKTAFLTVSPTWRLAGTQPAEALELLLAYLLNGAVAGPKPLVRAMFRLVLARQPAALRAVLQRYGPAQLALLMRLASVATLAELAQLVPAATGAPSKRHAGQQALAALDSLAGAEGTQASAGLRFLKIAYLAFHFQPLGAGFSLRDAQRLATTQRLPWRALVLQIKQYQKRWPALAATAFFARLWSFASETSLRQQLISTPSADVSRRAFLAARSTMGVAGIATADASFTILPSVLQSPSPHPELLAAQEGVLYYLLHGQAPWWQPTLPSLAELRQTLATATRQPLAQAFWQRYTSDATVRHRLAALADFSLLHTLTKAAGPGHHQRQLLRPAFHRLDQLLRAGKEGGQSRFQLFLREAYLASAIADAVGRLEIIRQLATAAGLSWRAVLHRVGQLVRQVPALAADPFFALLLQQLQGRTATIRRPATATRRVALPAAPHQRPAASASPAAPEALEHYLRTGGLPASYTGTSSSSLLADVLHSPNAEVLARIQPYLRLTTARHRLAAVVPSAAEFLLLLRWLSPAVYQALAGLVRDWLQLQAAGLVQLGSTPADLWVEALALTQSPLPAHALPSAFVQALLQGESTLVPSHSTGKPVPEALRLLRLVQRSTLPLPSYLAALLAAQLSGNSDVTPPLSSALPLAQMPGHRPPLVRPQPLPPAVRSDAATYVANAGLVLAWPFLTLLFERLGYVAERQFIDLKQATRAAYLLQFLATGQEQSFEHLLALNKLLCGMDRAAPLLPELPLTADEKATGESLLGALMARWGAAFKNTSIAGLRETFLQRTGKLVWSDDRVTLTVETKTVDILLDQRPWSIALIKLPWMPLPLYVTWR